MAKLIDIDEARIKLIDAWQDDLIREAVHDVADYAEVVKAYKTGNIDAIGAFFLAQIDKHIEHMIDNGALEDLED